MTAPDRIRVAQDADGFWTCREAVSGSQEYVRADLYAALEAQLAGARVKPLEWEEVTAARSNEDPRREPTGDYEAVSPIGVYCIEQYFGSDSYGWRVTLHGSDDVADKDDPDDAKAAAQADYERRILSALTPSPLPAQERPAAVVWFRFDESTGEFTGEYCAVKPHDARGFHPYQRLPSAQERPAAVVDEARPWSDAQGSRPPGLADDLRIEVERGGKPLGIFQAKNFNWDLWCRYRAALSTPTQTAGGEQ